MTLPAVDGGDGVPPQPDWIKFFSRKLDRARAAEYWGVIVRELRAAEKLSVANGHAIIRLVVAYVNFDRSAKEVAKLGPVMKAPRTKVPTYNPWWTTMQNAASAAAAAEKDLCLSPRDRGAGAKVTTRKRKPSAATAYLRPVAE
ncbi:P27 family phage terminase small subunit [Sphingobium phenoxybenzoativorans]|uniref:P27 family phage terminase small subunit n=1 Tax=Sphingobium phenoxybenzoativorans TaxID=1592790 RepID=A0A975K4S1_9SPHN|nr:P27 family phage terminase small subunit [Sphingobium phenoxybenzoativorans]QUT04831.1 P27 family phage terminase small subunit [Sphingobium phenoxybenzoativorans]